MRIAVEGVQRARFGGRQQLAQVGEEGGEVHGPRAHRAQVDDAADWQNSIASRLAQVGQAAAFQRLEQLADHRRLADARAPHHRDQAAGFVLEEVAQQPQLDGAVLEVGRRGERWRVDKFTVHDGGDRLHRRALAFETALDAQFRLALRLLRVRDVPFRHGDLTFQIVDLFADAGVLLPARGAQVAHGIGVALAQAVELAFGRHQPGQALA